MKTVQQFRRALNYYVGRCSTAAIFFMAFMLMAGTSFAAEFNDGDACTVSGSYHVKNDTEGAIHLICNGTTWERVLVIDKDDLVSAPSYCDASGANCFDATYVQSGLIRPVTSAASPVFANDLNDLDNVDVSSAINGECISFNSGSGNWESGSCTGSSVTSIESIATAASPLFANDLDDIDDVNVSSPSDGECLTYNSGAGSWETGACGAGATTAVESVVSAASPVFANDLDDLDNVDVAAPSNGECLTYSSGTGNWETGACGGATTAVESVVSAASPTFANTLNDLDNVDTSGVTDGQCIRFNTGSGNWEATACAASVLTSIEPVISAAAPVFANDLNDLDDVNVTSASVNDILAWDGTNWIPSTGLPSDARLKENVMLIEDNRSSKILEVRAVSYKMIDGNGRTEFGVIAQDLEKLYPNLVSENERGFKSVNYTGLIAPMIKTIQDLSEQNKKLEERLKKLEKKIAGEAK